MIKNLNLLNLVFFLLFLGGCSGSDVYQGNWKATDSEGKKFEINFEPKSFSIKDENGKIEKYEYTQNSVKIENSIKSYGIQLSHDGRNYIIFFPIAGETGKAVILSPNNQPIYTLCRTAHIEYKDLFTLTK